MGHLDDGWANARSTSTGSGPALTERAGGVAQGAYNTATTVASSAAGMASGVAQTAYKYVAGDEKSRQAGKESSA